MPKRIVTKRDLEANPYAVWNAFVDLLATEDSEAVSPSQRSAQLVLQYEQEVQNGGHAQYFDTYGMEHGEALLVALEKLEAEPQRQIFIEALSRFNVTKERTVYEDLDRLFGRASPTLMQVLERYLVMHQDLFVTIER